MQAAHANRERVGQHGDLVLGEVERGGALLGLGEQRAVRRHVVGHIGDVDADQHRAVRLRLDVQGVVEVLGGTAVDGQHVEVAQVAALRVGEQLFGSGLLQGRGRRQAGLGEGHRLVGAAQGEVLVPVPPAGADEHPVAVVRPGQPGRFHRLADELVIRVVRAEQHRLLQPIEHLLLLRPGPVRDRLPLCKKPQVVRGPGEQLGLLRLASPLRLQLFHLLRAVHDDAAVAELEVERVGEHRPQEGGRLVVVHRGAELQLGEEIHRELVRRFLAGDLPEFVQGDGFGQGGTSAGAVQERGGQLLTTRVLRVHRARGDNDARLGQVDLPAILVEQADLPVGDTGDQGAEEPAALDVFNKAAGDDHRGNTLRSSRVMVRCSR